MDIQEPEPDPDTPGNSGNDALELAFEEARVLGCLLEKEMTTPEYYPMTLNALMAACNQKNNRNPVTEFDEATVEDAIGGLRGCKLAVMVSMAGSRVPKFKHTIENACGSLDRAQCAILTVLLLRGPQTIGELRGRTERMFRFAELSDVEEVLESLIDRTYGNLVKELPPGGGRKARTFAHLLCGDVDSPAIAAHSGDQGTTAGAAAVTGWRREMETELAALREEVSGLRRELDAFRQQFS